MCGSGRGRAAGWARHARRSRTGRARSVRSRVYGLLRCIECCINFVLHGDGDVVELEFEARGVSEARDVRVQCMLHGYERNNGGSLIENSRPVARRASDLYQFVSIFDTNSILSTAKSHKGQISCA